MTRNTAVNGASAAQVSLVFSYMVGVLEYIAKRCFDF